MDEWSKTRSENHEFRVQKFLFCWFTLSPMNANALRPLERMRACHIVIFVGELWVLTTWMETSFICVELRWEMMLNFGRKNDFHINSDIDQQRFDYGIWFSWFFFNHAMTDFLQHFLRAFGAIRKWRFRLNEDKSGLIEFWYLVAIFPVSFSVTFFITLSPSRRRNLPQIWLNSRSFLRLFSDKDKLTKLIKYQWTYLFLNKSCCKMSRTCSLMLRVELNIMKVSFFLSKLFIELIYDFQGDAHASNLSKWSMLNSWCI